MPERGWLFVPRWGISPWFRDAPRRVECAEPGVGVEPLPWSEGKPPITRAMRGFLARWARPLSWRQTARTCQTRWECVYRSGEWFVQGGLTPRKLEGVEAIGVDEIHWGQSKRADKCLTVIYPIDRHGRRLLWVGRKRTQATLRRGLAALGPEVGGGLRFVCSDMGRPSLNGMAAKASQALHVLGRFHITLTSAACSSLGGSTTACPPTARRISRMRITTARTTGSNAVARPIPPTRSQCCGCARRRPPAPA